VELAKGSGGEASPQHGAGCGKNGGESRRAATESGGVFI
jgi:hypothetical protein